MLLLLRHQLLILLEESPDLDQIPLDGEKFLVSDAVHLGHDVTGLLDVLGFRGELLTHTSRLEGAASDESRLEFQDVILDVEHPGGRSVHGLLEQGRPVPGQGSGVREEMVAHAFPLLSDQELLLLLQRVLVGWRTSLLTPPLTSPTDGRG